MTYLVKRERAHPGFHKPETVYRSSSHGWTKNKARAKAYATAREALKACKVSSDKIVPNK